VLWPGAGRVCAADVARKLPDVEIALAGANTRQNPSNGVAPITPG